VFGEPAAVEGWRQQADGSYLVTVRDVTQAAPVITRRLVAADADVLSIGPSQHSLEDVYLELVAEDTEAARE
jgi:ABC-2 type transport system ATP-binding protein